MNSTESASTRFVSPQAASHFKRKLAKSIVKNLDRINAWYDHHAKIAPPPFYSSVDIRDSGQKIVPVDHNLFPGGFNNICPEDVRTAPPIIKIHLLKKAEAFGIKNPRKILILPEAHTQNLFYVENLAVLSQLIQEAGFEVKIGWYSEGLNSKEPIALTSQSGKNLQAFPIQIQNGKIQIHSDFIPDLILVNNDFSSGYPKLLDQVTQPIIPSHALGWHSRKKSEHFSYYNKLATEFAELAEIDPWVITIETEEVNDVNFGESIGIDRIELAVGRILSKTEAEYQKRKIENKPYVFVKNNSGTYGMGILVVHTKDELEHLNRRTKNKMSVGKNRLPIQSVVVQEGVRTATLVDRLPAEPVVYMIGCDLIGGFLRTNTEKSIEENLNSTGMVFRKLCMADFRNFDPDEDQQNVPVLETVYGSLARISALATGYELLAHGIPAGKRCPLEKTTSP